MIARAIIAPPLIPRSVIQLALLGTEKPLNGRLFQFLGKSSVLPTNDDRAPKKTGIYIDGYNLYYGRLRGTPFKWLDVVLFFEILLRQRDQNEKVERINFFTAPALATFATHGTASVDAQSAYLRALKAKYDVRFEAIYGNHSFDRHGTLLPTFVPNHPYDKTNRVRVWKLEEKKTDVNLAISMYRDACRGLYDRIILVSNDSDAAPALEAIRQDFSEIMIGVVTPAHPPALGAMAQRRVSGSLANQAHWTIAYIDDNQLQNAQLPSKVLTKKKPVMKPGHW